MSPERSVTYVSERTLIRLTQFSRFPQVSDSKYWVLCTGCFLRSACRPEWRRARI